ncbi:MAG: Acid phosphatase [Myxococcales bacterium]|nr:Acid phosphatase [Myxococcales bacterium]
MRFGLLVLVLVFACGTSSRKPGSCDGPCPVSKIDHLIIVVQENHTFDSYFGRYCTAATGSNPTCTDGPSCCEAGPAHDPSGAPPIVLDDTSNAAFDPDHTQACELAETHGGLMDRYVSGAGTCSDPRHFAYADPTVVAPYRQLAAAGALGDRYFQPIAGQSSSNDMYLVRAQFVFLDNAFKPEAIGQDCSVIAQAMSFTGPTIGDVLDTAGVSWAFYVEGYQAMVDASKQGRCPKAPSDCPFGLGLYPCDFDPSDVPIDYYANLRDDPHVLHDYAQLASDLANDALPQVVFVRGLGYHSEHPGEYTTISDGVKFVGSIVDAVKASAYAPDTLVLITWDEGGGFFDHVAPPSPGVDGQPYGTRVPLLAVGPFASANKVSHVVMEHSSIVRFIEWNWLGMATGQLAGRDAQVANLGSMLDSAATGVVVPD